MNVNVPKQTHNEESNNREIKSKLSQLNIK